MYLTKVLKNILMYFILNLDIKKKLFLDMTFLYNQTHDSTQYYTPNSLCVDLSFYSSNKLVLVVLRISL